MLFSTLTETTNHVPSLELQKPGCQLKSADGSDLNVAGICSLMCILANIIILLMIMYMFLEVSKKYLLRISELQQFALNDDYDLQCNRACVWHSGY